MHQGSGSGTTTDGGYMIVNANTTYLEAGEKFNLTIEDLERWASEEA